MKVEGHVAALAAAVGAEMAVTYALVLEGAVFVAVRILDAVDMLLWQV